MTQALTEFLKINKVIIKDWINQHLELAKEQTINLEDNRVAERTGAIIEARTYKKLLNEIDLINGEKEKTNQSYI